MAAYLPAALRERAAALARGLGISRSRLVALALEAYLTGGDQADPPPLPPTFPGGGDGGIRQGGVYWVQAFALGAAQEIVGHPHVVLQEDVFNRSRVHSVVVCALTSNLRRAQWPGNVLLEAGEANLPRASVVEVTKVAAVDRAALGAYLGSLPPERVQQILAGMRLAQSLDRH